MAENSVRGESPTSNKQTEEKSGFSFSIQKKKFSESIGQAFSSANLSFQNPDTGVQSLRNAANSKSDIPLDDSQNESNVDKEISDSGMNKIFSSLGFPRKSKCDNPSISEQINQSSSNEESKLLFYLPPNEDLIKYFMCALQKKILLQGHLYLFQQYLCFHSNIFGYEKKKVIPIKDISSLSKAKTVGVIPNAIELSLWGKKYSFRSFIFRDEAFELIYNQWKRYSPHANQRSLENDIQAECFNQNHEKKRNEIPGNDNSQVNDSTPVPENGFLLKDNDISIQKENMKDQTPVKIYKKSLSFGDKSAMSRSFTKPSEIENGDDVIQKKEKEMIEIDSKVPSMNGNIYHFTLNNSNDLVPKKKSSKDSSRASSPEREIVNEKIPTNGVSLANKLEESKVKADKDNGERILGNGIQEENEENELVIQNKEKGEKELSDIFNDESLANSKIAPPISPDMQTICDCTFSLSAEEIFQKFFSDNAIDFLKKFHSLRGDKDFQCSKWQGSVSSGFFRTLIFKHPVAISLVFGNKMALCHQEQHLGLYKNQHLVIETCQTMSDIPMSDYFSVNIRFDLENLNSEENHEGNPSTPCQFKVSVSIPFSKKTLLKSKIEQSALEECKETYTHWIKLAKSSIGDEKSQSETSKNNDSVNTTDLDTFLLSQLATNQIPAYFASELSQLLKFKHIQFPLGLNGTFFLEDQDEKQNRKEVNDLVTEPDHVRRTIFRYRFNSMAKLFRAWVIFLVLGPGGRMLFPFFFLIIQLYILYQINHGCAAAKN